MNLLELTTILLLLSIREVCKNEFIIPLGPELKELYGDEDMQHSLRSLKTESVRPELRMTEIVYVYRVFKCVSASTNSSHFSFQRRQKTIHFSLNQKMFHSLYSHAQKQFCNDFEFSSITAIELPIITSHQIYIFFLKFSHE